MAIFAATDYQITLAGTDYSDWITSVSTPINVNDLDTTAFGDTWTTVKGGLKSGSITLNLHQDFANSGLDDTIFAALGTSIAVVVKPTSAAVGASNPSYSFSAMVSSWDPNNATVGDLATVSVTWPVDGVMARAEA